MQICDITDEVIVSNFAMEPCIVARFHFGGGEGGGVGGGEGPALLLLLLLLFYVKVKCWGRDHRVTLHRPPCRERGDSLSHPHCSDRLCPQ